MGLLMRTTHSTTSDMTAEMATGNASRRSPLWRSLFVWFVVGFAALGLQACGPDANKTITLEYDGPCSDCPGTRLDSLIRTLDGVVEVTVNEKNGDVEVAMDSTVLKYKALTDFLNMNGYNIDMTIGDYVVDVSCCEMDPLSDDDEEMDLLGDDLDMIDDDLDMDLDKELEALDVNIDDKALEDELMDDNMVDENDVNF